MKLPNRFALRTLLLLMLVVAAVLGLVQWRRLWVIQEIKSLNEIGNCMDVTEPFSRQFYTRTLRGITLQDGIWPTVKEENVRIYFHKNPNGTFSRAGDDVEVVRDEFKEFLSSTRLRLHFIGVRAVEFWQYRETGMGLERKITTDLNSID